jgi:hypothetical protein
MKVHGKNREYSYVYVPRHEGIWGSGGIVTFIQDRMEKIG